MNQTTDTPAADGSTSRFSFLDGLRGLAALGIAVYHIWRYEPSPYPTIQFVPAFVDWLLLRTWIGVQVLLVISGFVIAYSMRNLWVTPREVVVFVGRRLVRLIPPYWATLLIVIVLHWACSAWWNLPLPFDESLPVKRVLAHLAFLQDVLEQPALSAGIWTICIEVQFYVVAVLGWGLIQRLLPRPDKSLPRPAAWGLLLLFAPLAFVSLVHWSRLDHTEPWLTHFFGLFFLGMLTWWTLDRVIPTAVYIVILVAVTAQLVWSWKFEQSIALTATLAIFVAGRSGHLHDWLNWRWLQYLAKISYSLYLIHYPVSHVLTSFGWRCCGNSPTPLQATLILTGCLVASIGAGHFLYLAVERPSIQLAERLKRR